jgi:hypothetical protein
MKTGTLSLFVLCLSAGFVSAASAKNLCFDTLGLEWNVDRRSGTGTFEPGPEACGGGPHSPWSVSGTIEKTARKEYDVNLTAADSQECDVCISSYTITGHFSGRRGSGSWVAERYDTCGGGTDTGTWTARKHRCP